MDGIERTYYRALWAELLSEQADLFSEEGLGAVERECHRERVTTLQRQVAAVSGMDLERVRELWSFMTGFLPPEEWEFPSWPADSGQIEI